MNESIERTYPHCVLVEKSALKRFRGIAGELDENRNRLYGRVIEFAIEHEEEFTNYVTDE